MLIVSLALRDLFRDRLFLLCNVAVMVGVLVPLLILFGVKNGVYSTLIGRMMADPASLQIDSQGNAELTEARIAPLRAWPEVAFVTPKVRSQFDYVTVHHAGPGVSLREALLIPSGAGDPNLPPGLVLGPAEVAVSAGLARQMQIATGDTVDLVTQAETRPKQLRLPMTVRAVLPETVSAGRSVLAPFATLETVEAFYDAYALPEHGITEGRPLADRVATYAGVRIYARRLEDLGPLQQRVETTLGLATSARSRDVAMLLGLGRNLDLALGLTTALACCGLAAALLFGFWSDAMRKRGTLAALAMLGLPARALALLPLVQALATALIGIAVSFLLYALAARIATRMFGAGLEAEGSIARISPAQGGAIILAILGLVLVSATLSAWAAQRVDPARTLREGA
ncbi:ABC transporter permease family protein [Rhodobacter capsulatus]|uniref:ABC transporter permease n=1 Tax=Rhodobacter capsulatus TaxID=1061 RepID=UPI0003D388ED|nr:ABC transporter permease [Rhodobacter capsulatus]ETD83461.1 ABC transporter permease [Rhodobacter capsulatus YW1]